MDRVLVERAMAGDHEAFSECARLTIRTLYATARLILRDSEKAEDATQEALVAAWRDLSSLRDPDRFEAWLRQLLVRACYRELRRDGQIRRLVARVEPFGGSVPDAGSVLADRDQLERGFRHLPPDQRALIVLHHALGLPLAETADALGIPVGTVKSRLHRAMSTLRAALDADARIPGNARRAT